VGVLGRYGNADDISRAFRFQAQHKNVSIRSVNCGQVFIATINEDHSAHVIGMEDLGKLIDRLESETQQ
jgi:hypothetical protein